MKSRHNSWGTTDAEHSQLPPGVQCVGAARRASGAHAPGSPVSAWADTLPKSAVTTLKAVRRLCAGFVALAASLAAIPPVVAGPVEYTGNAAVLRTVARTEFMPRNASAIAEGPTRVALSWQAPSAAGASAITGYGIQFSSDGGASWSTLPSVDLRTTSFVHTVGLRPSTSLLYRVFSISEAGAGPAAVVSAATPAMAMPRIVDVQVTTDEGATRWYPPRREAVVTVRFDQAVAVHTELGTPRVVLKMGRPPHRQAGYASDYSGGSGTDRLTFRYPADWNQDLRDMEIGRDALHPNGARITNVRASHGARLAHGPATLQELDQVRTRSDTVLVMGAHAPTPAPANPEAHPPIAQIAQYDPSGSSKLAAMLTAAGALVAGTGIVHQWAPAAGREELARPGDPTSDPGRDGSRATVAVDLGSGVGQRAAVAAPKRLRLSSYGLTQTRVTLFWFGLGEGGTPDDYLIEYSDDAGSTWANLLGYDEQENDIYRPASEGRQYEDSGLAPGTSRSYRVTARNSGGVETSNEESITTNQMAAVPACAGALWSSEVSVGDHQNGSQGFTKDAGTSANFGTVNDADFSFRGATHILVQAYFIKDRPGYNVGFALGPDEEDGWDGLTFHFGDVALPLADAYAATRQPSNAHTHYRAYAWQGSEYSGTFDYELDDWVTVCLVDDRPGVTLTLAPKSIAENGESSTVTASVTTAQDTPFTVTVSAQPDSPAVDADFSLSTNKILSFAANATESTGTVTITAVTNSVDTPDKTIGVKGELSSGVDLRGPADVTLTITDDDDAPQLTLSVSPATIAEDGGEAAVTVSTAGSTFATQQVISLTFEGTATKGTDYSVAAESLTLDMGERSVSATVTAIDDAADESDEAILVTATHDGSTVGSRQRITIADTLSAAVSGPADGVNEGDDAEFQVTLSGGTSTADVEVNYAVDGDTTATSGTDFTAPSGKLTIAAGAGSGTITIETRTDQVLDPGEKVVLVLSSATTDTRTVNVDDTAKVSATIVEQGMVTVSVGPAVVQSDDRSTVAEGETASFLVTLSGAVSGTVSVEYETTDGTADSVTVKDYTAANGTLQFAAGDLTRTIAVATIEDRLNEPDETFTVTLTDLTAPEGVSLGTDRAAGTIEDDDTLTAALGTTYTQTVPEGNAATFEVDVSGGTSTAAVAVNYAVDGDSTATSGTDFTAPSGKLTITAGASSGVITIETRTDEVLDPGETVVVKLTSATTAARPVTVDATARKTATILEQGTATVSLDALLVEDDDQTPNVDESDDKSKVEEGETASFVVTLSRMVSGTVSVDYTTADGTAENGTGKDYTTASATLSFTTGDLSKTIEVTTLEDELNEPDETFTVTLSGLSAPTGVSLGKTTATGTIEDDDGLTAALGTHTEEPTEGDAATFAVDLSGGTSTADVEVNYAVDEDSTATSGTDYTAPSGKLTITAGESSATITIETLTDEVVDPGETVVVKLTSATTAARPVTVDDAARKTATIKDANSVTVSLRGHTPPKQNSVTPNSQGMARAQGLAVVRSEELDESAESEEDQSTTSVEEGATVRFIVEMSGLVASMVTVTYGTTDETAESIGTDPDYTAANGTLNFDAGDTIKTIEVTTLEDLLNEPDETFTITLTGLTGPDGVSLGAATGTGTIEDDDPVTVALTVALEADSASVQEGDDATFAVDLDGGTRTGAVAVSYTVDTSSTATPGDDYTAPSGSLTIKASEASGTITIATHEDDVADAGETVTLKLTGATAAGSTEVSTTTATVTITEEETSGQGPGRGGATTPGAPDPRGVSVSPVAIEVMKGGSSESYSLSLQSEPTGDVTIGIDGPGGGVQVSTTRVTFTPQTWSTAQTVQVSATAAAQENTTSSITHTVSGADYDGVSASPVTVTIEAAIQDTIQEDAGVTLGLEPRSNTGTGGTVGATGTDTTRVEGETARFFVKRTTASDPELTIGVSVTQEGDYLTGTVPSMIKLMPGENRKYIDVHLQDDATVEPDGSISVTISCNCAVVDGAMTVDVLNNDAKFAVADATAVESEGRISFTVRKESSLGVAMDLRYETRDGSATAGKDYEQPAEGAKVTIMPHQDRVTLTIPITDDALVEDDESFRLRVYHPRDEEFDDVATGTIEDDDSAVAKAWLSRFGRTVASHVVEAVDARLTGELGPVTQVTLGGTRLPSNPPPVQQDAAAAMPHTSMDGGALLAGSSFQLLATDAGPGGSGATGLTMWGRGAATGLQGRDEMVSLEDGQVGTGTVGVDYDWGGILAGLAVAYSGGGVDYTVTGGAARSDRAASWLISAHPYARARIAGDRLTAWGVLGYGLGQMTLAEDAQDEESGISLMMGAMGLRGVLSPETNRFGLSVKSDAFVTHLTAGEDAAVQTGAHRARLQAEGTYRMDFGTGGVLIPRLITGVRYDFGDVETGFGAEMGGGVTYTYPAWGLTAAANVRVLLTHQDSGFEEWGGGGSLRVTPGAAGLGPTVAVNTSLGVPASGAQRLWTSGVAYGPAPPAAVAPGANVDTEIGYGLAVADGGGMLTPYAGMAVAERGARAFRLGGRLSVGPSFSLSVQGERREATAGDASHGVSVIGALRW